MSPPLTPDFRRFVVDLSDGMVVKPRLMQYLSAGKLPKGISVEFAPHSLDHGPDGRFHPSTHPIQPARLLWYYLHEPGGLIPESLSYMSALSMTIGSAIHGFIQECMRDMGLLLTAKQMQSEGWTVIHGECVLSDPETASEGRCDGILAVQVRQERRPIWEFKTSNLMKLQKVDDLDNDAFMAKWPEYWLQVQEYMRLSGSTMAVVTMMAMGYPWEIREFHVPADRATQAAIKAKYLEARGDDLPIPCCGPKSKEAKACPARTICPIGLA